MSKATTAPALGVLMLDLQGLDLQPQERELLRDPQVGAVILFSRNYASRAQLEDLVSAIRECRPELLLAVDQEGGRVQRLREGFTRLPPMHSFQRLWQGKGEHALQLAQDCGWLMAAEVLASDIDFSFAPVLDLYTQLSQIIGDRAFDADPQRAAELAAAFMDGMHDAGMATTGKHFPGHGNVAADSHLAIPVDERDLQTIRQLDLIPFEKCLSRLDAIMPAHVIYPRVDPACAGFSRRWLQDILRQELGFEGVIFSDDLSMAGAAAAGGLPQRVDAALDAGCDMILVCNDRAAALQALQRLHEREQPPSRRLPAMRARQSWTHADLQASARWQQTRNRLSSHLEEQAPRDT